MKVSAARFKCVWLAGVSALLILILLARAHVPLPNRRGGGGGVRASSRPAGGSSGTSRRFSARVAGGEDVEPFHTRPPSSLEDYYRRALRVVNSLPNEHAKVHFQAMRPQKQHRHPQEQQQQQQQQDDGGGGGARRPAPALDATTFSRAVLREPRLRNELEERADGRFQLRESAHRYPTVSDYLGVEEGVYSGMEFKQVSKDGPRAFLLRKVLEDEDAEALIDIANRSLARSEVVHAPGTSGINSIRTSFGMFVTGADERHPANVKLREQAATILGVSVANVEGTQILRYLPGQFYRAHPDYFASGSEHLRRGGQRFATMLTWLNDPGAEGSTTKFPLAQIELRPLRNGAVLFYSMTRDGDIDPKSMHEAVPPAPGQIKWVAVSWVRQHEFH